MHELETHMVLHCDDVRAPLLGALLLENQFFEPSFP